MTNQSAVKTHPEEGVRIAPDVELGEVEAYRMPNGSRFVVLADESEETWTRYADACIAKSHANAKRIKAVRQ